MENMNIHFLIYGCLSCQMVQFFAMLTYNKKGLIFW